MRAVIQRVSQASVTIGGEVRASMGKGLLILLGIDVADTAADAGKLAGKIAKLRIFNDEQGLMNLPAQEVNAGFMVISQFTLHADTRKGNRPSYLQAARPEQAIPLYSDFIRLLQNETGKEILTGEFGADMQVALVNDGPVTIIMDTKSWE